MSQSIMVVMEGMGARPYPSTLNPESSGDDYGGVTARLIKPLDALATSRGIPALSTFVYTDPDLLLPLLDELEGVAKSKVQTILDSQREWHAAREGLGAVDALLTLLMTSASADDPSLTPLLLGGSLEPLILDLRALRHVLLESGARFHFEVV